MMNIWLSDLRLLISSYACLLFHNLTAYMGAEKVVKIQAIIFRHFSWEREWLREIKDAWTLPGPLTR